MQHIVILGGGLAGTFLAARLLRIGYNVSLIDDQDRGSASRVAAGLFNIITGRFGAKTWLAETLLTELNTFFQQDEIQPLRAFVHHLPIYRPFKAVEEYNKWTGRTRDPEYASLFELQESPLLPELLTNPWGGIHILPCGWVDTENFLVGLQQLLIRRHDLNLIPQRVPYSNINLEKQQIATDWGTLHYDHLVCAEGHSLSQNPFFPQLKVIPNKGELLVIEAPELALPFVLSRRVYLVPMGNQQFRVGATYRKEFIDPGPTQAGKEEIIALLKQAIKTPYQIVHHTAGIRPTTPNRRPIVGTHPEYSSLHVLGGLGTKGVLLAPYFSRLLAEKIAGKSVEIPKEAQLERFPI